MAPRLELESLFALACELAAEAGELLAERSHAVRTLVETKSTVTDMVTEVDREAEALIVRRILAARPDDAVLGEEGAAREGTSGVRWVIDPLDGTTNYIYGYPAFGVSIGVEIEGETVAGVVQDAVRGEMFTACIGRGASVDGRPISVGSGRELATALVSTGFAYSPKRRAHQGLVLAHIVPRVRDVRRSGSAALDLCWTACGRVDAYYELGLNEWDTAAGALIVREAGGVTAAIGEGDPWSTMTIATNRALMGPLRKLLAEAETAAAAAGGMLSWDAGGNG